MSTQTIRRRRVLCLAGPTGAGKTALAIRLAHELGCEIINADSRQVYADFPIITAQPDTEERSQAEHHLYGYLPCSQAIDVQSWMNRALAVMDEVAARGHLPLLVGGTGMYFQHLLHGIADIPAVDVQLHARLELEINAAGPVAMHERLKELDPELAKRLHPHDRQRIVRGMEVALGTGHALSWWHTHAHREPVCEGPLLVINTSLAALEPRLMLRIETMLAQGALEEGRKAWERCPDAKAPGWSGIGCREVAAFLNRELSLPEAKELWYKNTRAYAKRQITWFRGRREAVWIAADDPAAALAAWQAFAGTAPQG